MEKIIEAQTEYYGEYIPLYINYLEFWNPEKKTELDSDTTFVICQYLGDICSLINKDFRHRWKIFVGFHIHSKKYQTDYPKSVADYVTKLTIYEHTIDENQINLFPKLRELNLNLKNLGAYIGLSGMEKTVSSINRFKNLEKITITSNLSDLIKNVNENISEKIYIIDRNSEMTFNEWKIYRKIKKVNVDGCINYLRASSKYVPEFWNIFLHDLVLLYTFLVSDYTTQDTKERITKIKINVIMHNDYNEIDYFENIYKKLYSELGIKLSSIVIGKALIGCRLNLFLKNNSEMIIENYSMLVRYTGQYWSDIDIIYEEEDSIVKDSNNLKEYLIAGSKEEEWDEEFDKFEELTVSDLQN